MSDLIRREDAIDALCKLPVKVDSGGYTWMLAFDACCALDELPSAEPERKWISVNERLPKNEQHVLCAVEWYPDGETNIISGCRYKDGVWETIIEAPLYDYWTELADVLAWMPYPEPYRIGEEK